MNDLFYLCYVRIKDYFCVVNFFKKLFSSKPRVEPIDLSVLKTDLHSHLIPGIDDGSKDMEDTIRMLKSFIDLGYAKVITTPHVMSDFYKNTSEIILSGLRDVRSEIKKQGLSIEIEAGAEYYLDFHFEELIAAKDILTFGDNHVLFELSFSNEPARVKDVIFSLQTEGYKPIMAHVERYPFYFNEWEKLDDFRSRGCLIQLNINSLSGQYGPGVKKMAEELVDRDWVDVIGSDCHHMGHLEGISALRTNPYFQKLVKNKKLLNFNL